VHRNCCPAWYMYTGFLLLGSNEVVCLFRLYSVHLSLYLPLQAVEISKMLRSLWPGAGLVWQGLQWPRWLYCKSCSRAKLRLGRGPLQLFLEKLGWNISVSAPECGDIETTLYNCTCIQCICACLEQIVQYFNTSSSGGWRVGSSHEYTYQDYEYRIRTMNTKHAQFTSLYPWEVSSLAPSCT